MDTNLFIAVILGALASLTLNLGKGVQKWKVEVLKHKLQALQPENRKNFIIWLIGVLLTALAGPLYSVSFKFADQPSLITSLGGIGLIGVLIFSKIILKEHLNSVKISGAILIMIGTVMVNYFATKNNQAISFESSIFINITIGFIAFFSLLSALSYIAKPFTGRALAMAAGSCLGMSMILADVALVSSNGDLLGQFKEVYVYAAIMVGNCAFIITQFALMREDGSIVIPIIHSMVIIVSIITEYIIYSSILQSIQLSGVAVIILGVFMLTKKIKTDESIFEGAEA